jgi:hypothetical protein
LIYNGKKVAEWRVFSRALLETMALMGKVILVRLRSPERIFYPICLRTYFPTDLIAVTRLGF